MVRNSFTRGVVPVVVTLVVFGSVAVGPVAADGGDDGDGLLGGDDDGLVDDGENATVGGNDGISVGTDGASAGDTDVGTDDATDGGGVDDASAAVAGTTDSVGGTTDAVGETTDAVEGTTDGVEGTTGAVDGVAGDDAATDEVAEGNLADGATTVPRSDGTSVDLLTDGSTVTDLPADRSVDGVTDEITVGDGTGVGDLPDAGEAPDLLGATDGLVGDGGAVDPGNATVRPDELPGGDAPLPDADAPTELLERSAGTDDLPVQEVPADRAPATGDDAPVEPESLPYGSDGDGLYAACRLPVTDEDLPTEAAPDPGDLPVDPTVPGVPVDLVTADTVAGIVFGVPPRPCNVYDPHDPSVDPTEPPTSPTSTVDSEVVDVETDVVRYVGDANGRLEDGGAAYDSLYGVQADDDSVAGTGTLDVTDGRTDDYLLVQSYAVGRYLDQRGTVWTRVGLFGRYASAELACDDVDPGNHTLDEPTGECHYRVDGVPSPPTGPGDLVDTVRDPPEPDLPVDPGTVTDEIDGLPDI